MPAFYAEPFALAHVYEAGGRSSSIGLRGHKRAENLRYYRGLQVEVMKSVAGNADWKRVSVAAAHCMLS